MVKITGKNDLTDQERHILDSLEKSYTGAKMMGDVSAMTRISQAICAFSADPECDAGDIFIPEFQEAVVTADIG